MPGPCAYCGLENQTPRRDVIVVGVGEEDAYLCPHHTLDWEKDGWSDGNRIYCDYFHRGIPIPRLSVEERDDNFWATTPDPQAA